LKGIARLLQEFNTTPDADKARFFPTGDESEEFTCDRVCPPQVVQRERGRILLPRDAV
jgi:hypothetical protein